MDIESFEVGDRVVRCDIGEKATIIGLDKYGLYILHFDNENYYDLICDGEKLILLEEG